VAEQQHPGVYRGLHFTILAIAVALAGAGTVVRPSDDLNSLEFLLGTMLPTALVCGLALGFTMLIVERFAQRIGRARARSLVDHADRSTLTVATAVVVAVTTLCAQQEWTVNAMTFIALDAAAVIAYVFIRDVRAHALALSVIARAKQLSVRDAGDVRPAERVVDFGIGKAERIELAAESVSYRSAGRIACAYIGDPQIARALLWSALRMEALALIVAASVCLRHLLVER
jgi:hypothetical protein